VINSRHVGVWWICVKRFSLNVVELQDFIIIAHWDHCCHADYIFLFCLKWFHPLEVVSFIKRMVVDVVVGVGVVFDRLVHTNELVVEVGFVHDLVLEGVDVDMHTTVQLEVFVLVVTFVPPGLAGSSAEASLLSVFVDSPEVGDSVIDGLVVGVAGNHGGS